MQCIAVPETANLKKAEFKDEADLVLPSLQELNWDIITMLFEVSKV
jgi:hypothetical protein